ncbi:hypothetical protein HOG98_04570 [bacterium]|nr:hypothetical protein [bacterium]
MAVAIVVVASFKVYKADYVGIINEEAYTYLNYSESLTQPFTEYGSERNYVLNSFLIALVNKFDFSYAHCIRFPSVFSGILLLVFLALIINRLIHNIMLRLILFLFVSLNPFVFDLSILALGYTFSMTAVCMFFTVILYQDFFKKYRLHGNLFEIVIVFFANYFSMLSLETSGYILISLNIVWILIKFSDCFVFFNQLKGFRFNIKQFIFLFLQFFFFYLFLIIFLFFSYSQILDNVVNMVLEQGGPFSRSSLLINYLLTFIFKKDFLNFDYLIFILFNYLIVCFVFFGKVVSNGMGKKFLDLEKNYFILAVVFFIYCIFLINNPFYFIRLQEHVFFVLFFVMFCFLTLYYFFQFLILKKYLDFILGLGFSFVFIFFFTFPSLKTININGLNGQGLSGPLIEKLSTLYPNDYFQFEFSENSRLNFHEFIYYSDYGHLVTTNTSNIKVNIFSLNEKLNHSNFIYKGFYRTPTTTDLNWKLFEETGLMGTKTIYSNKEKEISSLVYETNRLDYSKLVEEHLYYPIFIDFRYEKHRYVLRLQYFDDDTNVRPLFEEHSSKVPNSFDLSFFRSLKTNLKYNRALISSQSLKLLSTLPFYSDDFNDEFNIVEYDLKKVKSFLSEQRKHVDIIGKKEFMKLLLSFVLKEDVRLEEDLLEMSSKFLKNK